MIYLVTVVKRMVAELLMHGESEEEMAKTIEFMAIADGIESEVERNGGWEEVHYEVRNVNDVSLEEGPFDGD